MGLGRAAVYCFFHLSVRRAEQHQLLPPPGLESYLPSPQATSSGQKSKQATRKQMQATLAFLESEVATNSNAAKKKKKLRENQAQGTRGKKLRGKKPSSSLRSFAGGALTGAVVAGAMSGGGHHAVPVPAPSSFGC